MKTRSRIILRIMIDIACLLIMGLFLVLWQLKEAVGVVEQLNKALVDRERLIAYAVEDNTAYTFVSTTEDNTYGDRFLVLNRKKSGVWERSYENDFSGLKPWKLLVADIDGDGEKELLTAVKKTTHYDKEEKNRLFVFNYKEGKLVKKWTGSDIAGNWEDFIAGDLVDTKGEEIIFITKEEVGKEKLFVYHWFDFGFLMLAHSKEYNKILDAVITGENQIRITYNDGQKKSERLHLESGLILTVD